MDFYDSIFQYDLEVQNKLTERLNSFFKSINLLKNESLINQPNNKESKYKHIQYVINEINSSNKFKTKLLLNQKKQLLLRMNNKNKNKINSKYYIYAKDMNKDNQKMDIIQIENTLNKKESNSDKFKQELEFEGLFNQKKIYYEQKNEKENIIEEKNNITKLESDINKIVCDIIRQNVKNIYNYKLNEISIKNHNNLNIKKEEQNNEDNYDNNTLINNNIKNNNYIKIDLPKKDIYFQDIIQGKENKKIHNNHSTEKNTNYIHYFKDNKKKSIKKELRNSVANNNGNHLKIRVYKNDILNFNNLNNNNINNLLINKMKNLKNDNNNNINNINIQTKKNSENDNKIKQKESIKEEKEDSMNNSHKKKNKNINDKNNNDKNNNNNNDNKNGEQNHKKMIIRNIQRIQIKNIKLKNNPTGYNLTNICKKKLEDFEEKNTKKSKQKNRQCASPGDVGLSNKKINILKFKLGKNAPTPVRKHTEKSFKKINDVENYNINDNSIVSIIDDKGKDIRFSSVKKKKIKDEISCNDLSQCASKKMNNNNNYLIRNYKTNINSINNNINNKNSFTKESENDNYFNYFIINRNNNNNIRKSLSKESGSHSYLPWNLDNVNAIVDKSNNKGKMIESYLNHALYIDKNNNFENNLKNIKEYKKRNSNNTHYIYNENIFQKNINNNKIYEQNYENEQIKNNNKKYKNKSIYKANNNFKENKNLADAGYNDTINTKDEPISYREGIITTGKRRILSTRVHIRGVNSSKNFNNILGKNV